MKKIYLSIITIGFMLNANAQLSLTKAFNEPVVGNVNTKKGYDSTAVLPKNVGINQVWNFASLTTNTVVEVSTFKTVASTTYSANFPSATITEDDGVGGFTYSKATSTQFELVGFENANTVVNFTNSAIAAVWPISYGYSNTDSFAGPATINGTLTGTAVGTLTTLGSGTGTLIIPGGASFTNILQVKTNQTLNISLAGGFITANSVIKGYDYYHSTQKFPLLSVSYNNTSGSAPSTSATIRVNNVVLTGINDLNFDASFSIFPNPAKNQVNVKLHNATNASCNIEIVNSIGVPVQSINLGSDTEISNNISISNLAAGIYIVKTTLGDKVSARKLIIE